MSLEDKKLEKLTKLLEIANEDFATPDDLIKLSEGLLAIITSEKTQLQAKIVENKGIIDKVSTSSLQKLNATEERLEKLISNLSSITDSKLETATTQLSKEIKRVEKKIPTKTDLTGLEKEIQGIKESFNTLPTELTINNEAIRDGLELLPDGEKLAQTGIEGLAEDLEEIRESVKNAKSSKDKVIAGVRFLRYLADVNIEGITDGQTIVWNATTGKFEPGSGGSGGGHTIQDEGTPLTQRTNLNFVGAGVAVTDDAGNDATIVTISGGGSGGAVDSVNGQTGVVVLDADDIDDTSTTHKFATAAEKTKLGHISVTQAVDLDAIETASHSAVTVTDSAEIDLTLTGQNITASLIAGSIDETKLDASVNASLDLADTAVQPAAIANFFNKTTDDTDDITEGATNKFATAAEKTKLGHISVTQAVDLDALETASHAAVTLGGSPNYLTIVGQVITRALIDLTSHVTGKLPFANIADVATSTVMYRKTAGSGAMEAQTLATLKTDLGLTGTNSGDQTSIVGITGTKAQFDTAVTDGNILYVGDVTQYTDELAQDAVGGMVDSTLVYSDATPSLSRAALTGAVTASAGSNSTSLGSFTKAQLDTAVSDGNVLYVGDVTTNATHTGEVTGSGALTVDKTAISNRTDTVITASDYILFGDASDTDNLKKDTVQGILDLVSGGSTTVSVAQTSHGLSAGNLIRSNGTDNQYAVADKDAGNTADAVGYVTAVADANNFTFQPLGHRITNNVPVATAGSAVFVGDSGALTTTEPTTVGQISKPVGIITASGASMVMFNMRGLEVAGATSLITSLDATAHRLFYSDGSGNVTELAFGADGTVLTSTGASSAPAFETPAGGSDYSMYAYAGGFY